MAYGVVISATSSSGGKTLLSTALLHYFKKSVRPYKCGPDFIDPQFHQKIAQTPSINLDGFMLNKQQLQWMFSHYMDKDIAIIEGVMGYYDGMDKQSSAYDIAKMLQIPSLLILDASGSYITIAAVLKGLVEFRADNTIKFIVLNKVSSAMHYELIKKHIEAELPNIIVLGWIVKDLPPLSSRHLGLDLEQLSQLDLQQLCDAVLEHIDIELLLEYATINLPHTSCYPFEKIEQKNQKCVVVYDENFSFLYHDNLAFLQERYKEVKFICATKDETIPTDAELVILPGGYVETQESFARIKNSHNFKTSLQKHAKAKKSIYAECAGLIYLGKNIDEKPMSGILDIEFKLKEKRQRLGYYKELNYQTKQITKGHAFHYSCVVHAPQADGGLYKVSQKSIKDGAWREGNIYATYLHTLWRVSARF